MNISVIISTYNNPEWLRKVLVGYLCQSYSDFEIVVADDGSSSETADLIDEFRETYKLKIVHVWHEDIGFRKTEILNKAVVASSGDYLIFTDGDCIPRRDFVSVHVNNAKENCFISGGAIRLSMEVSKKIDEHNILKQEAFSRRWLQEKGQKRSHKLLKCTTSRNLAKLLNSFTTAKATWNGGNASVWKKHIVEVNGFDQRMRYGAEDREFGSRLENLGIKGRQFRYSAILLHLDHARGYVNQDDLKRNRDLWINTRKSNSTVTLFGIDKSK